MEQELTISVEFKTSIEAALTFCMALNIDMELPMPEKIEKLKEHLHKIVSENTVIPMQNFIANRALAQANKRIEAVRASIEQGINVTIQ